MLNIYVYSSINLKISLTSHACSRSLLIVLIYLNGLISMGNNQRLKKT